ncbi:MAG: hypothetical protein K6T51_13270 [Rubrobacteraceae bacterium]|nr:hypothetical protein [Rubrobacteraceae bacterium]
MRRSVEHVAVRGADPHTARGAPTRLLAIVLSGVLIAVFALFFSVGRAGAAALIKGSFQGNAYATYANAKAGPVATSLGRSAFIPCPCNGTNGKTLSNTVDSVKAPANGRVLSAGVTRSTVYARKGATSAAVHNSSKVAGVSLFKGLIRADAIKAVANTSANTKKITSNARGSRLVNLRIAGKPVKANVSPNSKVGLPGIGYVELKHVQKGGNGRQAGRISVDMLTVVVTRNNKFGLPVGARIVVAHAASGFSRTQPRANLGGQAYAAYAKTSSPLLANQVGRAAFVFVGCQGTGGKVKRNTVSGVGAGKILSLGAGDTTAYGRQLVSGGVAKTSAKVAGVNLLGGIIRADAITAAAQDTYRKGVRTSSTAGSRFANLRVLGLPLPVNVRPNTKISLPGIGYVVINQQIIPKPTSKARTQVNGLHVYVTTKNLLGIPVGTEIIVAHADTKAYRF